MIHVESGRITPYAGGYDYYLEKSGFDDARAALVASNEDSAETKVRSSASSSTNSGYKTKEQRRADAEARQARAKLRKEVADLEIEIAHLEARQAELNETLGDSNTYANPEKARALHDELQQVLAHLEAATTTWERKAIEAEG